jgi:hypothetical protein
VAKDVKEVSGSDLSILGFASTEIDRNNKDLIFCSTSVRGQDSNRGKGYSSLDHGHR